MAAAARQFTRTLGPERLRATAAGAKSRGDTLGHPSIRALKHKNSPWANAGDADIGIPR
jgi:hypothetical protein